MKQEHVWMASKEVAEKLDLHVRTLRNWLDMFVPSSELHKNPQGHYLISSEGFNLLQVAKNRKDSGNSSLREIQREMFAEGMLSPELLQMESAVTKANTEGNVLAYPMTTAMKEVESTVQETLFQFQRELTNLSSLPQLQASILEKIADIEDKQEALRLEMRRVTFEMDLMHQRLTRRKHRSERYDRRWSLNPFRWFTRSSQQRAAAE
ncbi:helix-turn-helix domain-containing protein [Brevibacillus daliensis]|uniref:helix-turn-helix domain-containing protein n=1 Tax=Brevibacillus daliensis TaxID=2892995 RepID=UPI001E4701E9|nr:helix-turn-helix domain-containing protein [Brevibacillus daliensis]